MDENRSFEISPRKVSTGKVCLGEACSRSDLVTVDLHDNHVMGRPVSLPQLRRRARVEEPLSRRLELVDVDGAVIEKFVESLQVWDDVRPAVGDRRSRSVGESFA